MIISAIEHPAIFEPAMFMKKVGCDVTVVPCDENGYVRPSEIAAALRPNTRLVSVMHANNEVGTIQSIRQISELCHEKSVLVHTDASQSVGKLPTYVDQLEVDMLTVAGHKFYGPKGVGVLYVRDGLRLDPLLHGAAHEGGRRGGTENTPYIVGLGQAAHLAAGALDESSAQMAVLRDRLWDGLSKSIPRIRLNGAGTNRLPNTLSVNFPECSGQELLRQVPEICASTGSACHSTGAVHSATLEAMGLTQEQTAGTVRLSVGWYTSQDEVDRAIELLVGAWESVVAA